MQFHQLSHNGQPQPRAAIFPGRGAISLFKGFKNALDRLCGNTNARITDRNGQPLLGSRFRRRLGRMPPLKLLRFCRIQSGAIEQSTLPDRA